MTTPSRPSDAASAPPTLGRRAFVVGAGGLFGLAAARGFKALAPDSGPGAARTTDEQLRAFIASLNPFQRSQLLFPADHPSRQVANTVSFLARPQAGVLLSGQQLARVEALLPSMLSERGLGDMAGTFAVEGRPGSSVLSIYGDPARGETAHAILAGGHYTLRAGAGHGALAYGQQLGNGNWRVEGNAFARHGHRANAFLATLSADERARALQGEVPHELTLQPQGESAALPGLAIGTLGEEAREAFTALLGDVFGTFARHATASIEPERLHFASYESHAYYEGKRPASGFSAAERAERGLPYYQVWRIEGPGVVLHFKGDPHVHAYVQVAEPGRANIGEVLGRVHETIDGERMRALYEAAFRAATGEALAYQLREFPGRFCAGDVTTGLVWTADPYGERIGIATIRGAAMAEPLRARLAASGVAIDDARNYRIATTDWAASRRNAFGEPESVEIGNQEVREALIGHLRAGALERA